MAPKKPTIPTYEYYDSILFISKKHANHKKLRIIRLFKLILYNTCIIMSYICLSQYYRCVYNIENKTAPIGSINIRTPPGLLYLFNLYFAKHHYIIIHRSNWRNTENINKHLGYIVYLFFYCNLFK